MALTKAKIAENLHEEMGLNKREAMEIVQIFFKKIVTTLTRNEKVKLRGFGNFELKDKMERPGRNPKTGQAAIVSARRVVKFCAGQRLRKRVEANADRQT